MFADARYRDAFEAYHRVLSASDPDLVAHARKGKVRSALRLSSFRIAREEAEALRRAADDVESLTLYSDALWAAGMFDEAELAYQAALDRYPDSPRARFGVARSLATHGRTSDALAETLAASTASPRDSEILVLLGELYERLYRFEDAARVYEAYIALLPERLRNSNDIAALKVKLLRSFSTSAPVAIDDGGKRLHTVPFTLRNRKVVVEGLLNGRKVEFVLDTGAERLTVSRRTANQAGIRGIIETLITGVGAPGLRKLSVARGETLTLGSLTVRNFPVSIRHGDMPGVPKWQNETFSPMAFGLSAVVDYKRREVTLGRDIPDEAADFRLPMRVYRLPMVRGVLNEKHSAYFVVDTAGELMSISTDVASQLAPGLTPRRKIAIKVWGVTGLDPDAFLLTGIDLDFDEIEYRKQGVAVLNLRAPSVLLGFQVGGILGHRFLGGYKVAMDVARGELRLQRF
jgi:hypothetical protein